MRKCIGPAQFTVTGADLRSHFQDGSFGHGMPSICHDAEREGRFFALRADGRFVTMTPPRMAMLPIT